MNLINAYYKFELSHDCKANQTSIIPMLKVGNHPIFNNLFTASNSLSLKKVGPVPEIYDYVAHILRYEDEQGQNCLIVFETSTVLYPFGVIKVNNPSNDCMLFRIGDDNVYEVFISTGNVNHQSQLLAMFKEGLLNNQIDDLLSIIDTINKPLTLTI